MDSLIGQTVGSYRIIEKLGEGGMGEVYLAEHKYIARRAAVKFLLPALTSSAEVVSRFFSEARAASLIEHPGIVEVFDCEVHTDGRAYIVMEFLNGESLRGYLDRVGKLDGDQRGGLAICRQIASALGAAHAQGIVHRDLKPDNVFLHLPAGRAPGEPVVKLLDFGIAKLHGGSDQGSKTRTGQLLGTPLYMSPEQCRGAREVDSRSDVYSFGCIMFEMFCGRPPFIADGFGELIFAHMSEVPPEPLAFSPGLGPRLREVLLRCLEKAPERRPASMAELAASLTTAGAPDVVHLRGPVARARTDAPGARSPVGWASSPAPAPPSSAMSATPLPPVSTPPAGAAPRPPTIAPTTLGGGATEVGATVPRRAGHRSLVLIAVSLAGVAAIAIFALRGRGGTALPTLGRSEPRAAAPLPVEVRRGPDLPPATRPEAPAWSSITLTGLPPGATVRLDGLPAVPPLTVRRGPETHSLAVDADGFEPWEQSFDGSSDRRLTIELKSRIPQEGPAAKAKRKHERRQTPSHFNGFSDLY